MRDLLEAITPAWPTGFDAWEGFITLLLLAIFKQVRGTLMQHRARYIDRFGWSIILYDYVFAVVFFTSCLFILYPGLNVTPWVGRVLLTLLIMATIWQLTEILRAAPPRVDAAAGGVIREPEWSPDLGERRSGIDRRKGESAQKLV